MSQKLKYRYNVAEDMMTIEGIRYAGDFFRQFGHRMPLNAPMKIVSRDDKTITLVQIEPGDEDWKGESPIPPGHRAFFIPENAPVEQAAAALRALADAMEGGLPEPEGAPKIIMPPGHA